MSSSESHHDTQDELLTKFDPEPAGKEPRSGSTRSRRRWPRREPRGWDPAPRNWRCSPRWLPGGCPPMSWASGCCPATAGEQRGR